jgi:hypothetical protein
LPVMCLGPATFAQAEVALQTSVADFKQNLQLMLNGWSPEQADVDNYLRWLACRQWSLDELREGSVLNSLIDAAGGVNV